MKIFWATTILIALNLSGLEAQTGSKNMLDAEGRKTGEWISYYPSGEIRYRGTFHEGKPIDTLWRYYEDGNRKAIIVKEVNSEFYSATLFDELNRQRAKGKYLNERKHGRWHYFNEQGGVLIEVDYKQDTIHGIANKYFANGKIQESSTWVNNELDGLQTIYNESGQKITEITHATGQMHGIYKTFNDAGFMTVYGMFINGLKEGKWQYFNDQGKAQFQLEYLSGKLLNPELIDSIQKEIFELYEKNRQILKDPKNYLNDPFSYIRK